MNGYDAIAKALQAEGVETLVAFPHQTLIEAAAKAGIRPIICRQERAGINMADGFSRIQVFQIPNGNRRSLPVHTGCRCASGKKR